jgi:hypothetical protein
MAWREIELPKTITLDPIPDTDSPIALRMKNVYFDGEAVSDIEIYEYRGTSNMATTMSVPFNFMHNLPNRLLMFQDVNENDTILVASERSIQSVSQGSSSFVLQFVSSTENRGQTADVLPVPPVDETGGATFVGATNWSNDNYNYIISTTSGLEKGKAIVPAVTNSLVCAGDSGNDIKGVEVRYCYTYYNSVGKIEGNPSPPTSLVVRPKLDEKGVWVWGLEQANTDFPQGVDKIRLYRYTEAVNAFIRIAEIDAEAETADGWEYYDQNPIDYTNTNILSFDNNALPNEDPDAIAWHIDRMYAGQDRILRFSNVGDAFHFGLGVSVGGTNPLAGGFVKLTEPIKRLISWGSYLIIATTHKVYKAFEENGFVFVIKFDVPTPSEAMMMHKVEDVLVIYSSDGLYLLTPDEQVVTFRFNWKRLKDQRFNRRLNRIYPRLRKIYNRRFLEIEFIYENLSNAEWGLEYIRIDLDNGFISGFHTVDTFLGWGDR